MKNQEKYKAVFGEIHAPDDLVRKVRNISMENKKLQRNKKWKAALVSAAAALGLFVGANGICYAATGDNLVSKIVIMVNGEEVERDIEWHEEGDTLVGTVEYELEDDADGGSIAVQEIFIADKEDTELIEGDAENSVYEFDSMDASGTVVEEEDGKIYLVPGDGNQKIDITEDIADGTAEGTLTYNGEECKYVVVRSEDGYSVSIGLEYDEE